MAIGSLARRTGVSVEIRCAWDRRYCALRPTRTAALQRRDGAADVHRVLRPAARVAEGQRISDAAQALAPLEGPDAARGVGPTDALTARIGAAAQQGNGARVNIELDRAFAVFPLVQAMDLAVFPALVDIGWWWAGGEKPVAAEHLITEAAARRLSTRLSSTRRADGPSPRWPAPKASAMRWVPWRCRCS